VLQIEWIWEGIWSGFPVTMVRLAQPNAASLAPSAYLTSETFHVPHYCRKHGVKCVDSGHLRSFMLVLALISVSSVGDTPKTPAQIRGLDRGLP
jgi:hypothetical protein